MHARSLYGNREISSLTADSTMRRLTYRFCSRCGIRLYARGELPQLGGRFYALHVPTLDHVDRSLNQL